MKRANTFAASVGAAVIALSGIAIAASPATGASTSASKTSGTIVFVGTPGTKAPPSKLGTFKMRKFPADKRPLGAKVSSVSVGKKHIQFSFSIYHVNVCKKVVKTKSGSYLCKNPKQDSWLTWSNGFKGAVYEDVGVQITITLPKGTKAFYFYAEPNAFKTFGFSAVAQNGTTSGPVNVNGFHGARYFGFYCTGNMTLKTIKLNNGDTSGFAIGEFGIAF